MDLTKTNLKYICEKCHFKSSNKKDYNKHLLTLKHQKIQENNITLTETKNCMKRSYDCICGKTYSHRQSLFTHKKSCNGPKIKESLNDEEFILEVLKKKSDFLVEELINKIKH
jgi:hypothetical protein